VLRCDSLTATYSRARWSWAATAIERASATIASGLLPAAAIPLGSEATMPSVISARASLARSPVCRASASASSGIVGSRGT
jgi:hypothetical protein